MNFFEQQEVARRSTKRLIVLFVLAVIGVVIAVNAAGAFIYFASTSQRAMFGPAKVLPNGFFLTNTAIVLLLIGGGTWFELSRLSAGGEVVANMAGGRLVDPGTRDLLERRLVNVVEEMAIASGIPVPRVYVLDNESTINAFAAGNSVNDAVVAVTRGTITRLSRDELQGVIGHEFSHILNGDMRLNLRLIGVLFGLLMIAMFGRFLMEMGRGSREKAAAPMLLAGIALWIIGYIGVFFGRLIKAGVSRQREFLADASAVQFTRNPDGIGGALRKIGGLTDETGLGTEIRHPNAEALSHLFLGAARTTFVSGLFATHPPLEERVRRIYGRAMEFLPAPEQPLAVAMAGTSFGRGAEATQLPPLEFTPGVGNFVSPVASMVAGKSPVASNAPAAIGVVSNAGREVATTLAQRLDAPALRAAVEDTTAAQMLVFGLLLDKDATVGDQQRRLLSEAFGASAVKMVDDYYGVVQTLPPGARLPLLDRVMPTLRRLPASAAQKLLMLAHTFIAADGRITLAEFLLYTVLKRRLGANASRAVPVRYRAVTEIRDEAALVLSLIANVRVADVPERAFKAGVAVLPGFDAAFVPQSKISLDAVAAAFEKLNQLAPLVKPGYIKACTAVAYVDGETNWRAASCLRTTCIALDSPLPPQVIAEPAAQPA